MSDIKPRRLRAQISELPVEFPHVLLDWLVAFRERLKYNFRCPVCDMIFVSWLIVCQQTTCEQRANGKTSHLLQKCFQKQREKRTVIDYCKEKGLKLRSVRVQSIWGQTEQKKKQQHFSLPASFPSLFSQRVRELPWNPTSLFRPSTQQHLPAT